MSVHFSSEKMEWATPRAFFDKLNAEFGFNTDVCALPENAKCAHYFTPESGMAYEMLWFGNPQLDAFKQDWRGVCFMNPPYGREIGSWMKRALEQSRDGGATVVCLVPSRTDTAWWHDYAVNGEIRFLRGRLKFGGHENSAPFPSAVVIFRGKA